MSEYEVFSGPYFPVFEPNTGKYGTEKTLYLDTFHAALVFPGTLNGRFMHLFNYIHLLLNQVTFVAAFKIRSHDITYRMTN